MSPPELSVGNCDILTHEMSVRKCALNVLIGRGVDLDGFDQVGGGVGHLFG